MKDKIIYSKKILIVSRSFYPMNSPRSFRTTELAKEFSRQGHRVTVVTFKDKAFHQDFEKEYGITLKNLGTLKWKPIELKGSGFELFGRRLLRRTLNLLFQYPEIELQTLVKHALEHESGFDLMISVAAPHSVHWGVARVKSKKHPISKVWVADCGDPFMGQENDTFKPLFYFKYLERWFCRKADYITVPVKGAIRAYYPDFHHKIRIIPQGFRFEDIIVKKNMESNTVPTFAYAGGFIPGIRDPSQLLEYLVNIPNDFKFHIYTNSKNLVSSYIDKSDNRIILHEYIPRKKLISELCKMDFLVNFENSGDKQTPSKLIDYAIIKKPILSIKTGVLDIEIIEEFLSGKFGRAYKIENIDQYRIENVARQFLNLAK